MNQTSQISALLPGQCWFIVEYKVEMDTLWYHPKWYPTLFKNSSESRATEIGRKFTIKNVLIRRLGLVSWTIVTYLMRNRCEPLLDAWLDPLRFQSG